MSKKLTFGAQYILINLVPRQIQAFQYVLKEYYS